MFNGINGWVGFPTGLTLNLGYCQGTIVTLLNATSSDMQATFAPTEQDGSQGFVVGAGPSVTTKGGGLPPGNAMLWYWNEHLGGGNYAGPYGNTNATTAEVRPYGYLTWASMGDGTGQDINVSIATSAGTPVGSFQYGSDGCKGSSPTSIHSSPPVSTSNGYAFSPSTPVAIGQSSSGTGSWGRLRNDLPMTLATEGT